MSKFTSGPWKIKYEYNIFDKNDRIVATAGGYNSSKNPEEVYQENIANTHLISAAPDLLEACKNSVLILSGEELNKNFLIDTLTQLSKAIKKAENLK